MSLRSPSVRPSPSLQAATPTPPSVTLALTVCRFRRIHASCHPGRIVINLFFREIRPRGAFNIPRSGPVLFVGGELVVPKRALHPVHSSHLPFALPPWARRPRRRVKADGLCYPALQKTTRTGEAILRARLTQRLFHPPTRYVCPSAPHHNQVSTCPHILEDEASRSQAGFGPPWLVDEPWASLGRCDGPGSAVVRPNPAS